MVMRPPSGEHRVDWDAWLRGKLNAQALQLRQRAQNARESYGRGPLAEASAKLCLAYERAAQVFEAESDRTLDGYLHEPPKGGPR